MSPTARVATGRLRQVGEGGEEVAKETVTRVMWKPRSFGTWSSTMTTPMPALKPIRTGSEMKLATKPSRRTDATTRIAPTRSVSVAEARRRDCRVPPPAATPLSSAPTRMAIVVVVLT